MRNEAARVRRAVGPEADEAHEFPELKFQEDGLVVGYIPYERHGAEKYT
jgi:hypothetical protein